MKKSLHVVLIAAILVFAAIGMFFTVVYFGMQFGMLNVRGSSVERDEFFAKQPKTVAASADHVCADASLTQCDWAETAEWAVIKEGFIKDAPVLTRVSMATGVPARMIVAAAVPEQVRFFTSEREVFKRYFEPLKILGSLSQFSLGISGIKQETADDIEKYANDPSSPFYPGPGLSSLIAYPDASKHDAVLYDRLTDPKNHYYSYLYTALFIREVEAQWSQAGFDISHDAGAATTIFNIGFRHSTPNGAPKTGGAPITAGGHTYSYGSLGALFYQSSELLDIFPR